MLNEMCPRHEILWHLLPIDLSYYIFLQKRWSSRRISSRKIKFYWRHHNKFLELKVGKIQNRSCYQNLSNGSKFQDNCSIMVIIPIFITQSLFFWNYHVMSSSITPSMIMCSWHKLHFISFLLRLLYLHDLLKEEEEVDEGRERTLRSDIKPREQMMSRHGGANRILR